MEFDLMTIQSPVKMLSKYGIQIAHEGTSVVIREKIDNLNRQYELFRMKEWETI